MNMLEGVLLLVGFVTVMLGVTMFHRGSRGLDQFLVSGRSVGMVAGGMGVAAAWIWSPSFFIAAQKAFQQGLPGVMWFIVPNALCLALFAVPAARIRRLFPEGHTAPEYIARRFDTKTHVIYLFCFLSLQVCSLAVQLIAGASMLSAVCGLPYKVGVALLTATAASYSLIDGLRSSIRAHVCQLAFVYLCMLVLVPAAIFNGGGLENLTRGFAGASGAYGNIFGPDIAYTFGITVTIGLISGPIGDQKFWQRAYAFRQGAVVKGYLLGAVLFVFVPLSMSLLGFVAAGNALNAAGVAAGFVPVQQVGPDVIRTLLPWWGIALFVVMVLSGLSATGDSALCAGGSLIAVDVYKRYVRPNADDTRTLRASRYAVLGVALTAVFVAYIPGVTILGLFLFYGTLRSATLAPTLLTLFSTSMTANGVFWGILVAVVLGVPAYVYGELAPNIHVKVAANIGIVLISLAIPLFWSERNSYEVPALQRENQV